MVDEPNELNVVSKTFQIGNGISASKLFQVSVDRLIFGFTCNSQILWDLSYNLTYYVCFSSRLFWSEAACETVCAWMAFGCNDAKSTVPPSKHICCPMLSTDECLHFNFIVYLKYYIPLYVLDPLRNHSLLLDP